MENVNDNPVILSFSAIRDWKRCRQLSYYKRVMNLRKRITPIPLQKGSYVHSFLEAYYAGRDWKELAREFKAALSTMTEEEEEYYEPILSEAIRIMKAYLRHWRRQELRTEAVEVAFGDKEGDTYPPVEILPNVFLRGRIDWIVEDHRGLWIAEHKTVGGSIPSEGARIYDLQTALYLIVAKKLGFPRCIGVMFDYVRTKAPTVPRLLKNGQLSRAKNIRTDYYTFLKAIKDNGLNRAHYEDCLERAKQAKFFERRFLPKPKVIIKNLLDEVAIIADEVRHAKHKPYRDLRRECDWCSYNDICTSELLGLDTEYLLKKEYVVHNEDTLEEPEGPEFDSPESE